MVTHTGKLDFSPRRLDEAKRIENDEGSVGETKSGVKT